MYTSAKHYCKQNYLQFCIQILAGLLLHALSLATNDILVSWIVLFSLGWDPGPIYHFDYIIYLVKKLVLYWKISIKILSVKKANIKMAYKGGQKVQKVMVQPIVSLNFYLRISVNLISCNIALFIVVFEFL